MNHNRHLFTVPEDGGKLRIDKFLTQLLKDWSRVKVQQLIKDGAVWVNQSVVKCNYLVEANDQVIVHIPGPVRSDTLIAENLPLDIIYEDDAVAIINKPAQMVVHPDALHQVGTLANALVYRYGNLPYRDAIPTRPGLVHRLDKDTSGLLIVAKTEQSLADLLQQFAQHGIDRTYYALVWGKPDHDQGKVDTYLCRQGGIICVVGKDDGHQCAKRAVTYYRVIESWHYVTLVECRLETGRTHQIRVHMQHIGCPVFGDVVYGGNKIVVGQQYASYKAFVRNCLRLMPHQALHAASIRFCHPTTKKSASYQVHLPENFTKLIEKWSGYVASLKKINAKH